MGDLGLVIKMKPNQNHGLTQSVGLTGFLSKRIDLIK